MSIFSKWLPATNDGWKNIGALPVDEKMLIKGVDLPGIANWALMAQLDKWWQEFIAGKYPSQILVYPLNRKESFAWSSSRLRMQKKKNTYGHGMCWSDDSIKWLPLLVETESNIVTFYRVLLLSWEQSLYWEGRKHRSRRIDNMKTALFPDERTDLVSMNRLYMAGHTRN